MKIFLDFEITNFDKTSINYRRTKSTLYMHLKGSIGKQYMILCVHKLVAFADAVTRTV